SRVSVLPPSMPTPRADYVLAPHQIVNRAPRSHHASGQQRDSDDRCEVRTAIEVPNALALISTARADGGSLPLHPARALGGMVQTVYRSPTAITTRAPRRQQRPARRAVHSVTPTS